MITALQDAVNNPDVSEPFTIQRNPGTFAQGGWQASAPQNIKAYGTVGLVGAKYLDMVPEGDRARELRMFHSSTQMYVSSEDLGITADLLIWNGVSYRVLAAVERPQRGYFAAIAARELGE
jgi:hypothetical protein